MDKEKYAFLLLRASIAFVFACAAVFSILQPGNWIGFFPPFMTKLIPGNILLPLFSAYEIILAVWILSNKKLFYSSLLATLTLSGIIVFNLSIFDVIFRDVGLALASLSLVVYSYKNKI